MDYKRWEIKPGDLEEMNPVKVRDLIIQCFYEAQKETFFRTKEALCLKLTDDDIHKTIVGAVRITFKEVGADFENPTRDDLMQVVELLGKKSACMGTPKDIIVHHKNQMQKIFAVCP